MNVLHQVIIIGAGASGLGAAYNLSKLKIPHIIIQSRSKIGGRIRTTNIDGSIIHLAACYIHSPNQQHSILNVMKQLNLKPLPNNYDNQTFLQEGVGQMNQEELKQGRQFYNKIVQRIVSKSKAISIEQDRNLLSVVQQFLKQHMDVPQKVRQIAMFLMKFEGFFEASDLQHLSLKAYNYQRSNQDYIPPGGYFKVLESIYNSFKSKIIFDQRIVSVQYSHDFVTLKTDKNQIYTAKYLISSLPLGVLKKGIVKFHPPLPKFHQHAIENITSGIMNKIYLKFDRDFWTKKGNWNYLFTNQPFTYNVIVNEAQTSKNVLCVKVGGFQNLDLFKKSDKQIAEDVIKYLKKFYKNQQMNLKGYFITRWHQDENTYGSYCTLRPGESRQNIALLAKPIDNKIWFIGQHCSPQKFAYAHGAFESGQKAANQIAKLCLKVKPRL